MKCAEWEKCSEVSFTSEMLNLKEVEGNLQELQRLTGKIDAEGAVTIALSFVHQAIQALSEMDGDADLKK